MKAILFQIEFCWDAEGAERSFSRTIETLRSLNKKADVIVPEGGFNRVALDLVMGRVQRHLNESGIRL